MNCRRTRTPGGAGRARARSAGRVRATAVHLRNRRQPLQRSVCDSAEERGKTMAVDEAHSVSRGASVRVAIIDTGVDLDHPDLPPHLRVRNFVDNDTGAFQEDAHGTAIAGVIAAIPNNGVGIVGIAPDVRLYVYKACWRSAPSRHQGCLQFLYAGAGPVGGDRRACRHHQLEPGRSERSAAHASGRTRGGEPASSSWVPYRRTDRDAHFQRILHQSSPSIRSKAATPIRASCAHRASMWFRSLRTDTMISIREARSQPPRSREWSRCCVRKIRT